MTGILVDTSVLISFYQNRLDTSAENTLRQGSSKISIMTYFEILRWFLKIGRQQEREFFSQKLKSTFSILTLNPEICEFAARTAHSNAMSTADALIYATARHYDLKLLSSDSDLKGMPGVLYFKPKR